MNEISRVFAPFLFKFLRLPKFLSSSFENIDMMHTWKQAQDRPELGMWQLTPTKQKSRPEIQA